jgi:hypothetical protein
VRSACVLALTPLVIAAVTGSHAMAQEQTAQTVRWFHSPSGNIECEVASRDPRGTYAYCQTFRSLRWARLGADGHTRVCSGHHCSVGNGPLNALILAYGRALRVGIFRCSSSRAGIRCVIVRSGHGFAIARAGITRF